MKRILAACTLLMGCTEVVTSPSPTPCEVTKTVVQLEHINKVWAKEVTLPATGKFVMESHYATTFDFFPEGRLFPNSTTERIDQHTERACTLLKRIVPEAKCGEVYKTRWANLWTPPENGKAGQGARGDKRPDPAQEMFQANMMFKRGTLPTPGEKWLIGAGDKYVVVSMGFEMGPGGQEWLGGVSPEIHYILGTDNDDDLTLYGKLTDQSVPFGPLPCGKK